MRPSQVVLIIVFFIYLALGAGSLALFSTQAYYDFLNEMEFHYHGFLSLLGTFILGCALLIFRLLAGTPTITSRYSHMSVCIFAFILILIGIIWADVSRWEYIDKLHVIPGYISITAFAMQITYSLFLLTFLYSRRQVRSKVALFHNIIGLAIYIFLLACCLTGAQYHQHAVFYMYRPPSTTETFTTTIPPKHPRRKIVEPEITTLERHGHWELRISAEDQYDDFGEANQFIELRGYNILLYLQFIIVVFSVLSPYFEWELVYPI